MLRPSPLFQMRWHINAGTGPPSHEHQLGRMVDWHGRKAGRGKALAKFGMGCLQSSQGIAALEAIFHLDTPQIAVQEYGLAAVWAGKYAEQPLFNHYKAQSVGLKTGPAFTGIEQVKQRILREVAEMLNIKAKRPGHQYCVIQTRPAVYCGA